MSEERKKNPVDPARVKAGDLMAFTYYVKVRSAAPGGNSVVVEDLDNNNAALTISGRELVERAASADQSASEERVTKTQAAELLVGSPNRPLTVCFDKQDGTERVLRGRLIRPEPLLGRSMVEDLDEADPKKRVRQVDHRTLKWLVVDGVRYTVK